MAYNNNGYQIYQAVSVQVKQGGTNVGSPQTFSLLTAFGSYTALTSDQFSKLTEQDRQLRLVAFLQHISDTYFSGQGFVYENESRAYNASACPLNILVSSVKLNQNTLSLRVGESYTLVATVLPASAANKELAWSSSNNSLISAWQNGLVQALAAGTATVRATAKDGSGKYDECIINISSVTDYTKLLLHFNSLPIVDESGNNVTVTNNGVAISNGMFSMAGKFNPGYLEIDRQIYADLIESGTFTIDFWVRPRDVSNYTLLGAARAADDTNITGRIGVWNGIVDFYLGPKNYIQSTTAIDINKWSHIAVVCENKTVSIYINGAFQVSGTLTGTTLPSYPLYLGAQRNQANTAAVAPIDADFDEVRFSRIARWTANFTPPNQQYSPD